MTKLAYRLAASSYKTRVANFMNFKKDFDMNTNMTLILLQLFSRLILYQENNSITSLAGP